jgi:hypothetical protein
MNWLIQIETEFGRIQPEQNPGRTRTSARRIAGIALEHHYGSHSSDFLQHLHRAEHDVALPVLVRAAANRLATRLDTNFSSPSADPVGDAMIIVEHVKQHSL